MAKPHYQRLRDQIFQDYLSGPDVRVGQKLPTEQELKSRYEVSRHTISKAIVVLAEEGRVTKRQGSGIYVANLSPQAQESSRSRQCRIGCIVQYLRSPLAHRVFEGVESVSRREHCILDVAASDWKIEEEKKQIELMRSRGVQGIVLYPTQARPSGSEYLATEFRDFPIVVVDSYQSAMKRPRLMFDNVTAGREVTRHLLAQDRRTVAFIKFSDGLLYRSVEDRLGGYRLALQDVGERLVQERVIAIENKGAMSKWHIEALEQLLALKPRPSALIVPDDSYAEASIDYLRARGIAVPQEMVVAGFDDLQKKPWGERFPTTQPDFVRMGERAAEMLLERIVSRNFDELEVVLPCPFVPPPSEPAAWRQAVDAVMSVA